MGNRGTNKCLGDWLDNDEVCKILKDTADSATIKAFFKWVSASISTGSQKVEDAHGDVTTMSELPPPPPEVNIVV